MGIVSPYKVLQEIANPLDIAEEFLIAEFVKMFPDADENFYDHLRFYVRRYRYHYHLDRFWRLVAGLSADYMLKSIYRALKGSQYRWSLEEVPLTDLYTKMFEGRIGEILSKVDYNVAKGGEVLRNMPPKERLSILDPFKFNKDNYPIIVLEENGQLIVNDGNRRSLDTAAFGLPTIKAYIGRPAEKQGKPAIHEGFFTILMHLLRDNPEITDEFIACLADILATIKILYLDAPEIIDKYIPKHVLPELKNEKQKEIMQKVLDLKVDNE